MTDAPDDGDDIEDRLDRLESTLEELKDALVEDGRVDRHRRIPRSTETARRLTERLAVPAAMAALEANVRVLEFLQDRLADLESSADPDDEPTALRVSDRMLDRLDDALARMEDVIAEADLPRDAEARRLLERARDLNADVRDRAHRAETGRSEPTVIEIDVEEELDQIKDDVDAEDDDEES